MQFVSLLVALVLIVVAEVRCEERCELCIPTNDVRPFCARVGDEKLTFGNKMAAYCNLRCGQKLELLHDGPCDKKTFNPKKLAGFTCSTCMLPQFNWEEIPTCALLDGKKETYASPRHAYCNGFCGPNVKILHEGKC